MVSVLLHTIKSSFPATRANTHWIILSLIMTNLHLIAQVLPQYERFRIDYQTTLVKVIAYHRNGKLVEFQIIGSTNGPSIFHGEMIRRLSD